jgi:hypothetical protein
MRQSQVIMNGDDLPASSLAFYRNILKVLNRSSQPFLVGGAYALNHFTGISRHTKDFDLFIKRDDYEGISRALWEAGYETELTYPHWLAKVHFDGDTIDLVFSSGNGVAEVDQSWFDYAVPAEMFGIPAKICPAEETLWSKAYIMERERFDGADVAHLILAQGPDMDWSRLLDRFGSHWRLLLSHLTLFGFIYPAHRKAVPTWVMDELLNRLRDEHDAPSLGSNVCSGTLLSREQYLSDIFHWGYEDARVSPHGNMTEKETAKWTEAIKNKWD